MKIDEFGAVYKYTTNPNVVRYLKKAENHLKPGGTPYEDNVLRDRAKLDGYINQASSYVKTESDEVAVTLARALVHDAYGEGRAGANLLEAVPEEYQCTFPFGMIFSDGFDQKRALRVFIKLIGSENEKINVKNFSLDFAGVQYTRLGIEHISYPMLLKGENLCKKVKKNTGPDMWERAVADYIISRYINNDNYEGAMKRLNIAIEVCNKTGRDPDYFDELKTLIKMKHIRRS
ncbi:MAG: hypothetical protein M1269_08990 [Chloroflexi bacterium]|nr:hypothetical protein [Chloroflexota bacterium]